MRRAADCRAVGRATKSARKEGLEGGDRWGRERGSVGAWGIVSGPVCARGQECVGGGGSSACQMRDRCASAVRGPKSALVWTDVPSVGSGCVCFDV